MRQRTGFQTVAGNPTLVGAVTVLIVMVAVFLAYNANTGLPFVPTYKVTAQVPNATALVDYNEVRVGGNRVGVVEKVRPFQLENGKVGARLDMKLDKRVKPLPTDSTLVIRTKSTLGLKYVELVLGDSEEGFAEGSVMPLSAARPEPVDLDQFFNMFDEKTRAAIHVNLTEFGAAFAGRGAQFNEAFGELPSLLRYAYPVTKLLANPSTDFGGFWRAMGQTAAEVAPVAEEQASMFVALDITFAAFARVARPYIQQMIVKSPPTLDAVTVALPASRPFLRSSAEFFHELQPGARALAKTSPILADALTAAVPVLNASPKLNRQLAPTARALLTLQEAPGAMDGLKLLTKTNQLLKRPVNFLAPAQTTCNYLTILTRDFANIGSDGDAYGKWLRVMAFAPPGDNAVTSGSRPEDFANNIGVQASAPANGPGRGNFLNYNTYPYTAAPGQPFTCEAGNETFSASSQQIGNTDSRHRTKTAYQFVGKGDEPSQFELPRIKP